ncbi:DUF1045 domain-containing protein [Breoghania sp. L-A4]|uniref:DUF1045 domain-containing protein n=1 Tax=Breoghania sp. L-A4 TaxID=2304600 RepID=UPI000E358D91|nr:DUF1045 domain-containing protein [Breoghania sp. L-A4]AXS39155.1 DUF1045 domain-containing protein [Breoghania sp. L-A4]
MRTALYFTPRRDHPLLHAAVDWLGRDAYGERVPSGPDLDGSGPDTLTTEDWAKVTAAPRRYGFHATVKAPFRLARGKSVAELDAALSAYCLETAPVILPGLRLSRLGSFFALVPSEPSAHLQAFAGEAVRAFEPFRAELSDAEIARREKASLTQTQRKNIRDWGYPYVFDDFRFHMTLTGPVPEADQPRVEAALRTHFHAFLGEEGTSAPFAVDTLALFVEPEDGADFTIFSAHDLRCP